MKSKHFISLTISHATPLLLIGVFSLFIVLIQKIFGDELREWGFTLADKRIAVDEDLPNFFKAIKISQSDEMFSEQSRLKKHFGFETVDPDTIKVMQVTRNKMPDKAIVGTPWY